MGKRGASREMEKRERENVGERERVREAGSGREASGKMQQCLLNNTIMKKKKKKKTNVEGYS